MKRIAQYRGLAGALSLVSALLLTEGLWDSWLPLGSFVSSAEARVGRPRTPRSVAGVARRTTPGGVAGVARRTTRRVVRRSTIYLAALPPACVTVNVNGTTLSQCGGVYYQPYGGRYVVVYVD
ncbi:hypothetical protein B5V01_11180 [Mesorhizobium erdmanii]|uniref:Uncharacterized protein n=2 Tax=Mesorhizobium TaxID=68287 RepID=A0A3M9XCT9_9HYPH|nr:MULTISPECIES: hypothetical protein [Mesorhizobium]RNJ45843.1 hypothetical protein DNR46_10325 [Mesorhizobium japonicum]RXT47152.1 hypothetical protein B5V01_11180 [Mesorhizobium erdmanii]